MRLSTLLPALPGILSQIGAGDPDITLITADSRQVTPGALFVATRGENFDAHRFIPQAIERGAAAVVAEEALAPPPGPYGAGGGGARAILVPDSREALGWLSAAWHGFPSRRLTLIGVTGTDGKTTTASLIHSILLAAGLKAGLISTVSAVIGDETLDTGFHVTTPDAPAVQGYLARMVAAGLTHCVLEVTSHGLAQQRVTGCDFDVTVVTNITHEHLDYHQTYENYRAAKGKLFEMLSTSALKPGGPAKSAVLNLDDDSYAYLASILRVPHFGYRLQSPNSSITQSPNLSISQSLHSAVWSEDIHYSSAGLHFRALGQHFDLPVTTALVGAYNISNCLAAIAATVCALGLPPAAAQRGLAALPGVPGRMERVDLGQPFTAIVDFAHTPNALRRALETARQMTAGQVIAVFGSAGLRDVAKRRLMAETAVELADISIFTAEDPRTESLDTILEAMAAGARAKGAVEQVPGALIENLKSTIQNRTFYRIPDRGAAIRFAVSLARPGDVVLACGKGHEQSMCFGTVEYPWDDRLALRAALAELLQVPGPKIPALPTGS